MNDFKLLILNSQQFFLAFLCVAYVFYFLRDELSIIRERWSVLEKKYFLLLFSTVFIGLFITFLSNWKMEGLFYSIEFSLLIVLSLLSPKYAVGLFVYLLLSRPWETFDNQLMSSMPRDISYLVFASIIGHKILKKQFYVRFNLGSLLVLLFAVWMFLSAFFSAHSSIAIAQYVEVLSKGIILFILIQNGINKVEDVGVIKISLVLAILEKSFISFYKTYLIPTNNLEEASERLVSVGILGNSNDIAAIFVLVVPFLLFYILKTKVKPFSWMIASLMTMVMIYLIWESQSRGALLAVFLCFSSWFILKIRSKKLMVMVLILGALGAIGSTKLMNRGAQDLDGSTSNRLIFWKAGANMAIRNPIFGVGYWGFNQNFSSYAIDGNTGSEGKHMTAHSSWILVLAEGGFFALFTFTGLWLFSFYRSWLLRKTEPEYFMAIVGYGVSISFLSHSYLLFPYILLALVISHSYLKGAELSSFSLEEKSVS